MSSADLTCEITEASLSGMRMGYEYGRLVGRHEMLQLMALGAACAEIIYDGLDRADIHGGRDWYDREVVARRVAEIAAVLLAYPEALDAQG